MRLARISFSMAMLHLTNGIPRDLFVSIMKALPVDARVREFRVPQHTAVCELIVESQSFRDCGNGNHPNDILVAINRDPATGEPTFHHLDMSQALDPAQALIPPPVPMMLRRPGLGAPLQGYTPPVAILDEHLPCDHDWQEYVGLTGLYRDRTCRKCSKKERL